MLASNESKGLALARGFIVLIMPAVHTALLYSSPEVKNGLLETALGFLAEQPGAPLFMFLMGLFIALGRKKNPGQVLVRMTYLLIAAYLLNFVKLVLPFYWGWLPQEFLLSNGVAIDEFTPIRLFLTGDILQLAAISYPLCWLILQLKNKISLSLIILLLMLLASPYMWQIKTVNWLLDIPLSLLTGKPPKSFFPVFPWICYPLAGLSSALLWQRTTSVINRSAWLIGVAFLIAGGWTLTAFESVEWCNNFYRLGPGSTLFHIGVVMLWIAFFVWLAKRFRENAFFSFLNWLSANITIIYVAQWIVITWLLPVFGYAKLSFWPSLAAIALTSFISFSIPFIAKKIIPIRKIAKI